MSERISNEFFSEHKIYGFGFPVIIKSKQGKSIGPKELNNICIVFHVCWFDKGLKHDIEESIITVTS